MTPFRYRRKTLLPEGKVLVTEEQVDTVFVLDDPEEVVAIMEIFKESVIIS